MIYTMQINHKISHKVRWDALMGIERPKEVK